MNETWMLFHVLAVFFAFALSAGVGLYQGQMARSHEVRAIRVAMRTAAPLHAAGGILIIVGAILGVITAINHGYSLTAPWLVAAYILVALILLLGLAVSMPWARRIEKAAMASPDDAPSPELRAALGNVLGGLAGPLAGLLWIAVTVDMILKP